jgi:MFS family permease
MVVGLPGLLLAALTLIIIKEPQRQAPKNAAGQVERIGLPTVLRHIFKNNGFYVSVIGAITLNGLFCYGANAWLPSFLQRVHGFPARDAGVFLGTAILVLGIPGTLLSGWIADRLIIRGRSNGHLMVCIFYLCGTLICGALGPIVPIKEVSLALLAGFGFFLFTWTGVATALIQLGTPVRMRGQVSALYLFSVSLIGLGVGPTAMGLATDYVFKSDLAVGKSISLVGIIAMLGAIALMYRARKFLPETLTAKS